MANVLVVGSGGREHALGWKCAQSDKVDHVFFAPGNGGTETNVDIEANEIENLVAFAKEKNCATLVGPEMPLERGIVDRFQQEGLDIFGPSSEAAFLETSKNWAKKFMRQHDIPTAPFAVFEKGEEKDAKDYVQSSNNPVVVKADGLASGKGVIVCNDKEEAMTAVDNMLKKDAYGRAGNQVVIEEKLDGMEVSFIALCDGKTSVPMVACQDHKRIGDGDTGPNTGGMGAYSPVPLIDQSLSDKIQKQIIEKTISKMNHSLKIPFKGFLYAGLMIKDDNPYVLEFNVRMGDPECQPIIARMDSDLFEYVDAAINQRLDKMPPLSWKKEHAVCVVMASKGYPGKYPKGEEISGLNERTHNSFVFHAGTKKEDGKITTNGGRVLGVTGLGDTLKKAIENAYARVSKIHWQSKYYRTDIGKKGLV